MFIFVFLINICGLFQNSKKEMVTEKVCNKKRRNIEIERKNTLSKWKLCVSFLSIMANNGIISVICIFRFSLIDIEHSIEQKKTTILFSIIYFDIFYIFL